MQRVKFHMNILAYVSHICIVNYSFYIPYFIISAMVFQRNKTKEGETERGRESFSEGVVSYNYNYAHCR